MDPSVDFSASIECGGTLIFDMFFLTGNKYIKKTLRSKVVFYKFRLPTVRIGLNLESKIDFDNSI